MGLPATLIRMGIRGPLDRHPTHRLAVAMPLALVALACASAAGCGEATIPSGPPAKAAGATATAAATTTTTSSTPPAAPNSTVARIDASSDAVLAEGKVHIAPGAASDAEIRREIREARRAGIVLPSGDSASSFEQAQSATGGSAAQIQTPEAAWNPRLKPIADWIVPVLQWASLHGWAGTVTSGYRTYYEQAQLNAAGAFSAVAGHSNHETTVYPGGAVDVTNPSQLIDVLRAYPGPMKLVGGVLGPIDPEHFSATGD
ncbi:MAG TPA: hypothetical protein VG053_08660 [Solirubrobacteraceae bacterium]|nr:hypothetical protein [Solirubrobacteraceae bacterium]